MIGGCVATAGQCCLYCSGMRGMSRKPGTCSLKCDDWSLTSPVSGTSVCSWGSLTAIGCALPLPNDWMTVLFLDTRLTVGEGGCMAAGSWACCSYTRGSSSNPGPCCLYCSGKRGMSRKPGTCSLKCDDWSLTSPVLSVRDVGVGRVVGSV